MSGLSGFRGYQPVRRLRPRSALALRARKAPTKNRQQRALLGLRARFRIALEPRRNHPAWQPVLAEAHIARTAKPALDLPVSAQALQGMLHAQMTLVTAARLMR